MSISVKSLTKYYGEQKALNGVSFEMSKGEIVGLLGPNGAGKSTLMKILTCYIPQSDGDASIEGLDIGEDPELIKSKVGYLPEHNPLYLEMYVREFLNFVAGIHKLGDKAQARVDEIIEQTGLTPEQHKKIGALSKGYRQRVGIAQAMIHDPEVLILDEPTSGLDPNQLIEIRNLIKEIGEEKTVLLSTHIMQEVEALCDRVIIINKGDIVADQPTSKLSEIIAGKSVIRVEFKNTVEKEDLMEITGVLEARNIMANTWDIESKEKDDLRDKMFEFAVENENSILSLNKTQRSIEQVFQELTK